MMLPWNRPSKPMRKSPPENIAGCCMVCRGVARTSSRSKATRPRGDRMPTNIKYSMNTPVSSNCCVMALSWTQDRLGPICRYAEDCAAVLSVIAKPDGKDLSVSEIPFNWNTQRDYRQLRVGYFKDAFADKDRMPDWMANDQRSIEKLQYMGVKLIPLTVPDFPIDVLSLSVEAAVFFDELLRSGQYQKLTNKTKADRFRSSRMVPAVEYLQSQRMRS